MATLNTRANARSTNGAVTHEGARAVSFDNKKQLERAVLSTMLWEDTFYESGMDIAKRITDLVKLNAVEDVTDVALRAKYMGKLRHIPLFLVRELFRRKEARLAAGTVLSEIITRPDDATEFLAMWWKVNKDEPLAKQAKKALSEGLAKFDKYQLQKYKKNNAQITLRDVFRLVHPKPKNAEQAKMWGELVNQEIGKADTWETALSAGADKKETFERLTKEKKLGGLALLRNLRNMKQSGMDIGEIKKAILEVKTDKLLPTQLIAAYRHNPEFTKELETLFLQLFANRPKIKGSTLVMVDVSSSMGAGLSGKSEINRSDAATGLAAVAREMFDDVDIFSFSGNAIQIPALRGFGLMDTIKRSQGCTGTYFGRSLQTATAKRNYDRIIVFTDEQSHDVPSRLPDGVRGYIMNVAPYKNGIGYGVWTRVDGWSDNVLDYIVEYEKFANS